ncbi:hypothetical protein HP439_08540 [Sphingobacterium shayense]|uniref:hypothetical protein n=1 Tax=Sphingobacterium shayense TaxID=626343 RepID=UPI00155552D6|nr:hypothetical protein [Sphingobacterium shayense]NQD70763.1 hypothetical protein [Sphingobacterium shayense]
MNNDDLKSNINEKLIAAGLFEEYEKAVQLKDSLKIQTILRRISLEDELIVAILKDLDTDVSS